MLPAGSIPEIFVPSLDSTMNRLKAITGEVSIFQNVDLVRLRTAHQWAGRGRRGRSWKDRPGEGILMSIGLRRQSPYDPGDPNPGTLALRVGAALYESVSGMAGDTAPIAIKWPNDLLLYDRKVAGILIEADPRWFYIGIGINTYRPVAFDHVAEEWIADKDGAASIAPASLLEVLPTVPVAGLLHRFDRSLIEYLTGDRWHTTVGRYLAWRGTTVAITDTQTGANEETVGVLDGIDREGAAVLRTDTGLERWVVGTLRHVT